MLNHDMEIPDTRRKYVSQFDVPWTPAPPPSIAGIGTFFRNGDAVRVFHTWLSEYYASFGGSPGAHRMRVSRLTGLPLLLNGHSSRLDAPQQAVSLSHDWLFAKPVQRVL